MPINRFDVHTPLRSTYIPQVFTPNFDLYKGILEQEQKSYDLTQSVKDVPIDALQGADETYAQTIRQDLYSNVDEVSNLYKTDMNAARRKSKDLVRETKRRTLPGGDIYDLAARKKQYTDFQSEQQKRLEKGEITAEQYWASVKQSKVNYDAAGGYKGQASLNLNSRQQAVNFDKFANEFLDNLKANGTVHSSVYVDPNTGNLLFDKTKVTQLEASKVQQTLSQAYKNAASQTGQLEDMYNYRNQDGSLNGTDKRKDINTDVSNINSLNLDDKKQAAQAQQLLNKYGFKLEEDGVFGKKSLEALRKIEELGSMSDTQYKDMSKSNYLDAYTNALASPYAYAKSYKEMDRDLKSLGRTLEAEIGLAKRKKELDTAFMFDGDSIVMDMGSFAKDGIKGLEGIATAQEFKISQLEAEKQKSIESGAENSPTEIAYIDQQIRWEQGKLDQLKKLTDDSYNQVVDKYDEGTRNQITLMKSMFPEFKSKALTASRLSDYMEASGMSRQEIIDLRNTALAIDSEVTDILQTKAKQNNQISFNTVGGLPKEITSKIEEQLQTMAFDFYDESGPIRNENQSTMFGEKEGTKPIGDKVKVRGISKTAWGNTGHLITLENTETGEVFYGAPRNSSLSTKIGREFQQSNDPEIKEIGFMMENATKISSQTTDLRDNIPDFIILGDQNQLSVPIEKIPKAYGTSYMITIPQGLSDAGKKYVANNDEELNKMLYIITQDGRKQ